MKHAFGVLLICGLLSCGAVQRSSSQPSVTRSFAPLSANEVFTSQYGIAGGKVELSIFRTDKKTGKSSLLFKIRGAEPVEATIVADGKKAFFTARSSDPNDVDDLWLVDGSQGKANPILKSSPAFAVSNDGRFVCFDDLKYQIDAGSDFPRISLYDLKRGKIVRSYDYTEKKYLGTGPNISFDVSKKQFHLEFTVEDETVGTSDIELP